MKRQVLKLTRGMTNKSTVELNSSSPPRFLRSSARQPSRTDSACCTWWWPKQKPSKEHRTSKRSSHGACPPKRPFGYGRNVHLNCKSIYKKPCKRKRLTRDAYVAPGRAPHSIDTRITNKKKPAKKPPRHFYPLLLFKIVLGSNANKKTTNMSLVKQSRLDLSPETHACANASNCYEFATVSRAHDHIKP